MESLFFSNFLVHGVFLPDTSDTDNDLKDYRAAHAHNASLSSASADSTLATAWRSTMARELAHSALNFLF